MFNNLVLRIVNSPYGDMTLGSVLAWEHVDNNFIYLKGNLIKSGITQDNNLYLQSLNGEVVTIPLNFTGSTTGGTGGGGGGVALSSVTFNKNYLYILDATGSTFVTLIDYFSGLTVSGSAAMGDNVAPVGLYSVSQGRNTAATGNYSHSEGFNSIAQGEASHVEGQGNAANGIGSHAEGISTQANGAWSHSEGISSVSQGDYSHAEGASTTAVGFYSHSEGSGTTANGIVSHAEGSGTTANGAASHAEGFRTIATGVFSHTEGGFTTASGDYSHAEGFQSTAIGPFSHAEGYQTAANSTASHAEGDKTTANGIGSHAEGLQTIANAQYSHAEGQLSQAIGDYSHSEGAGTTAIGSYSHAEGTVTTTVGQFSHAEGSGSTTSVNALYSHAEGILTNAAGLGSHAEGFSTSATTIGAHAEGSGTRAAGQSTHAEGLTTFANGAYSHAEGENTSAIGQSSHAEGASSQSVGGWSHAEGLNSASNGQYSHAEGGATQTNGQYSHSEGESSNATGIGSHAEGIQTISIGGYSHAEGFATTANGAYSHSEGSGTFATGLFAHAEGSGSTASGQASHAEGSGSTANGGASHAEGFNSVASGLYSHSEGQSTSSIGLSSHSEGVITNAIGDFSHSEGVTTSASGVGSHAEGQNTQATSDASHAEGFGTTASAPYSHSEGNSTIASGSYSHSEGSGTTASGVASHAQGSGTTALGAASFASGFGTIATGTNQAAFGKFNSTGNTTSLLVIGNGTSITGRSDLALFNSTGITFYQQFSAPTISATTYLGLPVSSGSNLSIGTYISASTSGSVLFVGSASTLQQDNSNFFYDSVNKMLLLGTNTAATNSQLFLTDLIYARNVGDGDLSGYVFGLEYIWAFHKKMYDQQNPVIVLAGDSTTAGSTTDANYSPQNLILQHMLENYIYGGVIYNDGVSGINTNQWLNTYLPSQIAQNPDLMIIRFGINDGANNRAGFETDLRAGLALIRASRNLSQTAIILMTPNSTNDTPNGRDEEWYLRINPIIRKAARDYNCVFIDTWTYFRDATNAGPWMDNPYGDGRHIHPEYLENLWIFNLVGKVMFPDGFKRLIGSTNLENPSSGYRIPNVTDVPSTYLRGICLHRATTGAGWPHDGQVITFNQQDGIWFQINNSYTTANGYSFRIGGSGSWGAWQHPFTNGETFLGVGSSTTPAWDTSLNGYFYNSGNGVNVGFEGNNYSRIYMRDSSAATDKKTFEFLNDSSTFTISRLNDSNSIRTEHFTILSGGTLKFNNYGLGTVTGTGAYNLQVDTSGNIIEAGIRDFISVSPKPTSYNLTYSDAGKYFTNEGAAGAITFNLPSASTNLMYSFIVRSANNLSISAATGDNISVGSTLNVVNSISAATTANTITLLAINSNDWIATSVVGTWS